MDSHIAGPGIAVRSNSNTIIPSETLDDLSTRFIINVPEEERKDPVRICFQIELAWWFYLDFYRAENPNLPFCSMREFARNIFNHIPFLREFSANTDEVVASWKEYKMAVPTYGAILLDEGLEYVLLVQGYLARASWGFPKGKVNEQEQPHDCAVREVLEETGFDISSLIDKDEYIDNHFNDQLTRLYIITGVPRDVNFHPKTRNEIKCIEWFSVSDLPCSKKDHLAKASVTYGPNAFFMVIPFIRHLRKWISSRAQKVTKLLQPQVSGDHSASPNLPQYSVAEMEKQKQKQQQLFSAMCMNDLTNYLAVKENPPPVRTSSRSTYSPPPRMLRQRNLKQASESERSKGHRPSPDVEKQSPNQPGIGRGKSLGTRFNEPSRKERKSAPRHSNSNSSLYSLISSTAWQNFTLDRSQLMACFITGSKHKAVT